MPGGAVEHNESPLAACVREVCEELGSAFPIKQLLCVEYQSEYQTPQVARGGDIHFVFYGGVLSDAETHRIRLPSDELAGFRFCERVEAMNLLCPRLSKRLAFALAAIERRQATYVENEVEVGSWG